MSRERKAGASEPAGTGPRPDRLAAIRDGLTAQQDAMSRAQSTLGRCVDGMAAINRTLDETALTLKSAARRLDGAAALIEQVERDGPAAALPDVIAQLRADVVDRSHSRFARQYADMLDRALEVQASIGRR